VTQLLAAEWMAIVRALDKLLPLVKDDYTGWRIAILSRERGDQTLQTTALVNEAYLS